MLKNACLFTVLLSLLLSCPVLAADPVHLYLDADTSVMKASSSSIQFGILTALREVGNKLDGRPVKLITLNHRGNSARSLYNLKKFLADPQALALFTGLHSPPLLVNRTFINENGILTLDPWAAAGPITRPKSGTNWIFRLSVDDSKAGEVIVRRAVDVRRFKRPALLLENTGWGKSNLKTMTASLAKRGLSPVKVTWFDWGLRDAGAKIMLREIDSSGADVIFLVGNAPEGKVICKALHDLSADKRLPLISHWGITGGDFAKVIDADKRKKLDLEFIQTKFSFMDMGDASFPNAVFSNAGKLFSSISRPEDIKAPTGFIHAYDLTRIFMAAVKQAGLGKDMRANRDNIRKALENLSGSVQGLIKVYDKPFQPWDGKNMDAHEALGISDMTFGKYGSGNEIILVR